jgi:hypothetical protein
LLQVVDVVNEDAVELVHLRVHVARNGDIDKKHGPVAAPMHESLAVLAAEDRMWRAGGADDDVGFAGCLVELLKWNDAAIEGPASWRARSWVRLVTRMAPAPC